MTNQLTCHDCGLVLNAVDEETLASAFVAHVGDRQRIGPFPRSCCATSRPRLSG